MRVIVHNALHSILLSDTITKESIFPQDRAGLPDELVDSVGVVCPHLAAQAHMAKKNREQ